MSHILSIAHRGAISFAPENTLEAFKAALEQGADGIELDVHLTADGQLAVIHDHTIDRTTDGIGEVCNLSLRQLRSYHISGKHTIPTLSEVLDIAGPDCLINIELKTKGCALPASALLRDYVMHHGFSYNKFIISSFDWTALQQLRETAPDIPVGVLTATDLDLAIAFAKYINAETIHPYYHLLTDEAMNTMRRNDQKVFTWTVNEPEDIQRVRTFKPNGIISDYPERIWSSITM